MKPFTPPKDDAKARELLRQVAAGPWPQTPYALIHGLAAELAKRIPVEVR